VDQLGPSGSHRLAGAGELQELASRELELKQLHHAEGPLGGELEDGADDC